MPDSYSIPRYGIIRLFPSLPFSFYICSGIGDYFGGTAVSSLLSRIELSPNLGDGRRSGGSGLSLRSDDLDSVLELYTHDDLGQLVVSTQAVPALLQQIVRA